MEEGTGYAKEVENSGGGGGRAGPGKPDPRDVRERPRKKP